MTGMELYLFIVLLVGALVGLIIIIRAFHYYRRKRLINDLPTSKVKGVFIGLTELSGTAETDEPLTSYLAEKKCVYYSYTVDEYWHRTVTETYTDSEGNSQTRTRTESGWKTVASGTNVPPFYLKDDTGSIRINPDGAEVCGKEIFNKHCGRRDALYYEKGPKGAIADSAHRRRFIEMAIPLHTKLYVVGYARERQDVVAAEIVKRKGIPLFLISTRSEDHHSRGYKNKSLMLIMFGFLVGIGTSLIVYNASDGVFSYSPAAFVLPVIGLYLIFLLLGWLWTVYNSLIRLRQKVRQGWSQIEIELKRRYDLIPRIAEIVEAYRRYESGLQESVALLRARADILDEDGACGIEGLLPVMNATVEKYPDLKGSNQFISLQKTLSETEQRLALSRDYYNQICTFYNTRLEVAPDKFLARITGFQPLKLLSSSGLERANVEVEFVD